MYQNEKQKGKLLDIEENDLQRAFLSTPNLHIENVETANHCVAEIHPELNVSSHVQMAAALVEQAMQGRWMPLEVAYHKNFESAREAFLIYHKLYPVRTICILGLVVLPFFEVLEESLALDMLKNAKIHVYGRASELQKEMAFQLNIPVWCKGELPHPCGDPTEFALSSMPYIERWLSLLFEALCLLMLVGSVALQYYYMGPSFGRRPAAVCKVVLLAAMTVTAAFAAAGNLGAIQMSMYLRVFVPVIFTRALRVCFRMTVHIVHTFADIAILLGLVVLLSAYIATLIFQHSIPEFEDYSTTLLNLFVLLTTANNPNVWANAYTADRRSFFFFFTYLIVGLFFLMNLVFTVIYSNYKAQIVKVDVAPMLQMANEVEKRTTARQQSLRAAFNLLDTREQGWIDGATMIALFHAMSSYSHIPDFRTNMREVFLALDKRGDFKIWQDEFEGLCDVIVSKVKCPLRTLPRPSSRVAEVLAAINQFKSDTEPVYNLFIWTAVIASMLVAICERETKSNELKNWLELVEVVFGIIFLLDVLVKVTVHGWRSYWRDHVNQFDFLLTVSTTVLQLASILHLVEHHWVSILFIARILRVFSFITLISRWHLMAQTLLHLIPATAPILALQFLVCTLFSLLGVHIFGGKVYLGNPLLENTDYATGHLYAFNYNDYASAMVTSFNLCIVNNWYVIMDAYAVVTQTPWSRAFFISFWAVAVAFTLNVVVAFFVEAFVYRMEKAEAKRNDSHRTSRSDSPTNERRKKARIPLRYSCYDLYEEIVKK